MPISARQIPLGSRVPWFRAHSIGNEELTPRSAAGQPLLIMFICNHSPYVRHIETHLGAGIQDFQQRGLYAIAVSPNDPIAYPSDDTAHMREQIERAGFTSPYILDDDQSLARAFEASCTPEFYLYADMEKGGRLVYHGEYDSTRPGHGQEPTGKPLFDAIEAVLAGKTYRAEQAPSFGCSVKWKSGQDASVLALV